MLAYLTDGSAQTICMCCHTEIGVAHQTCYLTQSQYTDTGPTSPSTVPKTPGQPVECHFFSCWCDSTRKGSLHDRVWEQDIFTRMIIIAFKGAIRDFWQSPHSAANYLQHARSSGPGAIVCKWRATHRTLITCKCHVTCHLVRRDSSAFKFDRVEMAFIWALFYWLNH